MRQALLKATAQCGSGLAGSRMELLRHQLSIAHEVASRHRPRVLLADEVGLGKTIEAGLLLAQRWSEGRRRLVVIAPASLTQQWVDELREKFHLPTVLLTSRNQPYVDSDSSGAS